jgi:hypothetical protein
MVKEILLNFFFIPLKNMDYKIINRILNGRGQSNNKYPV